MIFPLGRINLLLATFLGLRPRPPILVIGLKHERRNPAIEEAPSGGYAPMHVPCPENFTVRQPSESSAFIGEAEANYVAQKSKNSIDAWRAYLSRAELADFDLDRFLDKNVVAGETLPNIGLAVSGGGIRALLGGAGILHAFDDRNSEAVQAGTGGILQLANYVTGLSGSACSIGSWATSDFPTFSELNRTVWNLTESSSYTSWDSIKQYPKAIQQAKEKSKAGFSVSLVDLQAYFIAHHMINDTHHGSRVLFSSIRNTTGYRNCLAPFPILLSTSRLNGVGEIDYDRPIYEFSPEEFGVSHPTLKASIPIEFLGSGMSGGRPLGAHSCTKGFDNAGFVIGASSNIYSEPGASNFLSLSWRELTTRLYDALMRHVYDEAIVPNPFYQMGLGLGISSGYPDRNSHELYLADGGWGGEMIPLWPLLQPERKLDVIIAIDYASDGPSMFHGEYPNGTSLYTTYMKTKSPNYAGIHFPEIPDPHGPFVQKGLDKRPSFFGCYENQAPLVIYFPNYFAVANTKMATMKADYSASEINGFFENSFAIATQSETGSQWDGFSMDSMQPLLDHAGPIAQTKWKSCIACALIDRQLKRDQIETSSQCINCFKQYCA